MSNKSGGSTDRKSVKKGSDIGSEHTGKSALAQQRISETEVKTARKELDAIFNAAPVMIWQKYRDGRYVRVNDRFCETIGRTKDQIIGKTDFEIFPAEMAGHYAKSDQTVLIEGISQHAVVQRHLKADGTLGWSQTDKIAWKDETGAIKGTMGFALDITERKTNELEIERGEARMRALIERMPDLVWLKDPDGVYLSCNHKFERFFGETEENIKGRTDYDFVDSKLADFFRKNDKIAMAADKPVINEEEIVYADDGHREILETIKTPVYDLHGNLIGVLGIGRDITSRKKTELQLKESRDMFEKVFNSHLDAIFILDTQKPPKIVESNSAAERIFGYTKQEFTGGTVDRFHVDSAYLKQFQEELYPVIAKNEFLHNFRFEMKRRDGSIFPTEHTVLELKNNKNERIGWVSNIRDLSEKKIAEEKIQHLQRMESIGSLASGIAHDFNNILFPIMGISELMMEDFDEKTVEWANAREIFNAGKRGRDLIKQILAISRQSKSETMPVRYQQVLKEVLKLIRSTIPANIKIEQNIAQNCGPIRANPTQLHQVAMNIITNAYHALEDSGTISVKLAEQILNASDLAGTACRPGRYAVLTVSDTGCGISKELMGKIFDPYFTTKKMGKGSGLGLAVVNGIVQEHKGAIKVESEKDKGSIFKVYLPIFEKTGIKTKSDVHKNLPEGNEKILLVDDEVLISEVAKQALERLGYKVLSLTQSLDAFELVKENPNAFDLVISDLAMPNMTGDQLAVEIKAVRSDLPVIICTGFNDKLDIDEMKKMGIAGVLGKPVERAELAEMVRKVLDNIRKGTTK